MTNFEKYKDDILRIAAVDDTPALVKGKVLRCNSTACEKCEFANHENRNCNHNLFKWLYAEYKEPAPKLTAKERAFCEMVHCPQDYHLIRSWQGELFLKRKYYATPFYVDPDSFSFIKHDKLWSVEELLKLEVE